MNIRDLDSDDTLNFLKAIIASQRNIPFIGTGFTRGEKARRKTVPDGAQWMEIMRKQILASPAEDKPDPSSIEGYSFQELSDIYFSEPIVELETLKQTLDDHFSDVKIQSPSKKRFLNIDWPYIYTLNIDDGIENQVNGVKVVPYESFSRGTSRKYIYKLHGDAITAIKAKSREELKLVFGRSDYIRSLTKNKMLLDELRVDLSENNLIFIGCSLTDELDILYALAGEEISQKPNTAKRVYITSTPPSTYEAKKKLRNYNITDVIVGNYDNFYLKYSEIHGEINQATAGSIYAFQKRPVDSKFTKAAFFRYLIQEEFKGKDSSHLSIQRKQEEIILNSIEHNPATLITGARFSGRTSILYRILNSYTSRKSFFLTSEEAITDGTLNELLSLKNSLIAFDTGSLSFSQIRHICNRQESTKEANSRILIAANKSDLIAAETLSEEAVITIPNRFSKEEKAELNKILDQIGSSRLENNTTMLDDLYQVSESPVVIEILGSESSLKQKISDRINLLTSSTPTISEFGLLYVLAAQQKVFSIVYRALLKANGFETTIDDYIQTYESHWSPFVEITDTNSETSRLTHSSNVLISNSQAWIYYALRKVTSKIGPEKTSKLIVDIVSTLKQQPKHYELIMFDVLNSVFTEATGAQSAPSRVIIAEIYKGLASVLFDEPNYWLQRAKSIYHEHDRNTIETTLIAIEHANKAIKETDKTVTTNAKLTIANLYGLLCKIDKYQNEDHLVAAVEKYYEAFEHYSSNQKYLDDLLDKTKNSRSHRYLTGLLSNLTSGQSSPNLLIIRDKFIYLQGLLRHGPKPA